MTEIVFVQYDKSRQVVSAPEGQSVMEAARDNGVPGIVADCGGSMSCATCHVYIDADWLDRVGVAGEEEQAMLEMAINPEENSRLSCQVFVNEALDGLIIHVPKDQI